jgi:hypothetical protein
MNESQFIQWLRGYIDGIENSLPQSKGAESISLSPALLTIKHNLGMVYKDPNTKYNIESRDTSGYKIYGDGIDGRTTNSSNTINKTILKG